MKDIHSLPTGLREQLQSISDRLSPPRPAQSSTLAPTQSKVLAKTDETGLASGIEVIAQSNPELAALLIAASYGVRSIEFEDIREETKILTVTNSRNFEHHTTSQPISTQREKVQIDQTRGSHRR